MRLWLVLVIALLMSACSQLPRSSQSNPQGMRADVFIQAGHEGRTSGKTGAVSQFGREIDWTPVVADAATYHLRQAGFSVIRAHADWKPTTNTKLALFIHFDGNAANPCSTGASIGYDDPSDRPAAIAWRRLYSQHFPRWKPDNFTKNLSQYYMFKRTRTSDAELVLELGAMGCPEQALWLGPRLPQLGQLIAHFAATRMGRGNRVPRPRM